MFGSSVVSEEEVPLIILFKIQRSEFNITNVPNSCSCGSGCEHINREGLISTRWVYLEVE